MFKIYVIGVSGTTVSAKQRSYLAQCQSFVVSTRFRPFLDDISGEIVPITPLQEALQSIDLLLKKGNVAVLASGDPLFFGIGRRVIEAFGVKQVEIVPDISFMQLACARFKMTWDDARIISLHGRECQHLAAKLLRYPKSIIFTDATNSPDKIAGDLLRYLEIVGAEKKKDQLRVYVAQNLAMKDERLFEGTVQEVAARSFSSVNIMIVTKSGSCNHKPVSLGLFEADIRHSRGLITKDEVRAITLHKLQLPAKGVFWDIGGGSGSISIEAGKLCPDLCIYSIEKEPEQLTNICHNIREFETFNVMPVAGTAPDNLADLPKPDRVFVGGSSGRLDEILSYSVDCLNPDGKIVVNCVIEKTRKTAPLILQRKGCEVTLTEVSVSRYENVQDMEKNKRIRLNPITIVTGKNER